MPKKRVHEVAKELGLENKVLIAHLEKIGIAVKTAASSLDESEVERIKKALLATEHRETVEERIKSTVIRRRTVRTFIETPVEEVPEKEEDHPETVLAEKPEEVSSKQPAGKIDKVKKEEPPETPVSEIETVSAQSKEHAPKGEKTTQHKEQTHPKEQIPKVEATAPTSVQPTAAAPDKAVVEKVKHPPLVSTKPTVITKHKIIQSETSRAFPPKAPLKPGEKIAIPLPDKPKKKGKATVEVFIEEEKVVPLRKILEKKIEKRLQKHKEEDEVSFVKWRDSKKVVPTKMKKTEITVPKAIKRRIKVGETIAVGDLAKRMGVKVSEIINKLMAMDVMATINQAIDYDIATIIANEFGFQVDPVDMEFDESMLKTPSTSGNLRPRAPVVTIMGHVDHGKTSLLDVIRQSNVIDGEAGGITQAIGAYHVHINGRDIVFLDTPGHEAFTAMRARGAQVTDIVVLVVAADDGVMGQTIEAINHSKVAGVPIIVAINKIDKPGTDPEKIKQSLMEYGLLSEQLGGETIFCEVSAKKKINIEELLEMILLQADVLELKANPDLPARGIIIEAKLDRGRGPVATVLIQEGTLREGDSYVSKTEIGRASCRKECRSRWSPYH